FCSLNCRGGNLSGEQTVFGVVLKVPSCKCGAVDVHGRCVPSGYAHLICHLTDALTKGSCNLFVPCTCNHHCGGESYRTGSGKVIVTGIRSTADDGLHFSNGGNSYGLVTAQSDYLVHFGNVPLVQKFIPLC